ncbi:hypothetical protein ACU686_12065 [Yinghuangia aomiensis]
MDDSATIADLQQRVLDEHAALEELDPGETYDAAYERVVAATQNLLTARQAGRKQPRGPKASGATVARDVPLMVLGWLLAGVSAWLLGEILVGQADAWWALVLTPHAGPGFYFGQGHPVPVTARGWHRATVVVLLATAALTLFMAMGAISAWFLALVLAGWWVCLVSSARGFIEGGAG